MIIEGNSMKALTKTIDFHTHTLFSDGALYHAEHVRRAYVVGYSAIGISDHVDAGSLEFVVSNVLTFVRESARYFENEIVIFPGVELTHVHPKEIKTLTDRARAMGVSHVIVHGETRTEPVAEGTNRAAIEACVDILAHPGFITEEEAAMAKENGVYLELTHKKGHSITNGHVAAMARKTGASLIVSSDAHAPGDWLNETRIVDVCKGAGLTDDEYQTVLNNNRTFAKTLLEKRS